MAMVPGGWSPINLRTTRLHVGQYGDAFKLSLKHVLQYICLQQTVVTGSVAFDRQMGHTAIQTISIFHMVSFNITHHLDTFE